MPEIKIGSHVFYLDTTTRKIKQGVVTGILHYLGEIYSNYKDTTKDTDEYIYYIDKYCGLKISDIFLTREQLIQSL